MKDYSNKFLKEVMNMKMMTWSEVATMLNIKDDLLTILVREGTIPYYNLFERTWAEEPELHKDIFLFEETEVLLWFLSRKNRSAHYPVV